jgi:hypothetical protein
MLSVSMLNVNMLIIVILSVNMLGKWLLIVIVSLSLLSLCLAYICYETFFFFSSSLTGGQNKLVRQPTASFSTTSYISG